MGTALNVSAWSTTAASNSGADSTIGTVADTSSPTSVDDWVRAIMASVKRYILDTDGGITSSGTNTITVTTNRQISSGHQAAGFSLRFKAGGTNTGAATLNVDSLGAAAIKRLNGDALSAGDIVSGGVYDVAFDGTNYILMGTAVSGGSYGSLSGDNSWSGVNAFSSTVTMTGAVTVGDGSGDTVVIKGTTVNSYMSGLLSTASASALRTAIGLGTSATVNTGTSGSTIPLLSAANTWDTTQTITPGLLSGIYIDKSVSTNPHILLNKTSAAASSFITFRAGGSTIGSVTGDSSSVTYNTTSDGRLKPEKDRRPITDSGEIIDALRPLYYRWRDGSEDLGFIAQDAYQVSPLLAEPGVGEIGDDDFRPWTMERGRMEAIHTAELQAIRRRLEALEGA